MQYAATTEGKTDPDLRMELGAAHEAIHRLDEARAWYQFGIDQDPIDAAAQQALHRVRQQLDRPRRRPVRY